MVVKMYRTNIIYFSSNGCQDVQNTFFYQLIMEKDERLVLPTTQQLFELSFLQMGIKLQEVHLPYLTLNAPISTKVVCFSRLLKCLKSLYGNQCGPRTDCYRSSLFWVHTVCFYPPTKSEGYSFGVVRASVRPSIPSVRPDSYLSTYWSVLIHSWYK